MTPFWISILPPGFFVVVVIGAIVALNVYDARRRAQLTAEERRREDEIDRFESQIW